jgi:HEAT repeat protein
VAAALRVDEPGAQAAADALIALGEAGAQAAVAQLPGPLRLDRHILPGPMPPAAEHGPLLALLLRFGRVAVRPLLERFADPSLEVRFYATLLAGEMGVAEMVPALGSRVYDPDAAVRRAAAQALARANDGPARRTVTERLRGDLPGPDILRQRYAAEALGVLRDVPSVPRLIELVKHDDALVAGAARRGLIEITKQDFGQSRWRWRSWWERHRHEPRVEWMFEGLLHAEPDVRISAAEELRRLTNDSFGYHFDLPKREREDARKKWMDWWRAHGSK